MNPKIIVGLMTALSLSAATLSTVEAASKRLCPGGSVVLGSKPCPAPGKDARFSARGPKPTANGAKRHVAPGPRLAKRQAPGGTTAAKLPYDDPWITFCMKNMEGKELVACLYLDHVEP